MSLLHKLWAGIAHGIERLTVRTSFAFAIMLAVATAFITIQAVTVWRGAISERMSVERSAQQQADASLDLLSSIHAQSFNGTSNDSESTSVAFNSALADYAKKRPRTKLWVAIAGEISAQQRPRDSLDRLTISTGKSQYEIIGSKLRSSRPIMEPNRPGITVGVFSVEIGLADHRTIAWDHLKTEWLRSAWLILGVLTVLLLILMGTAFGPLAKLADATEELAEDNLDVAIDFTKRPDEVGQIARSLENFRTKLLEKRAITAENNYNAYLARHDGLTGLPNRMHFLSELDKAIMAAQESGELVAGIMIDLDRFKHINDRYGHEAGDMVLKAAATNCSKILAEGEFFARLGGDEFAAFKKFSVTSELETFIEWLSAALCTSVNVHGNVINPTASIGIAIVPTDAIVGEQLLNNADLAMYRAKRHQGLKWEYYIAETDERSRERETLLDDLINAHERHEFSIHYQAFNDAETGEAIGREAFIRWTHPDHSKLSPTDFIPLMDECGSIRTVGPWVLREACAEAVRGPADLSMAVNISGVQLTNPEFPAQVREALIGSGLSPARLELEMTEKALIQHRERAIHVVRQLKGLGVKIVIDDFGTGYSSHETIRMFPIDKIKIDRSCTAEFELDKRARSLVEGIIAIGAAMKMPVLAEGVETEQQLKLAREMGCSQVQGYYFSKPQAVKEPPAQPMKAEPRERPRKAA
jgi:diguanylate cyclase (GGDEF)-like protein